MKKLILSVAAVSGLSMAGFAQGTVAFNNEVPVNGNYLGYIVNNSGGTGSSGYSLASSFTVGLYYGDVGGSATTQSLGADSSGQLTYNQFVADQTSLGLVLASTTGEDSTGSQGGPGLFTGGNVTVGVPGTVSDDLVIAAWTGGYANLNLAEAAGANIGIIGFVNQLGAGGSSPTVPQLSGWAALPQNATDSAFEGGVGAQDIVMSSVTVVPEPSTLAMAGVGLASMLIFRRRNK